MHGKTFIEDGVRVISCRNRVLHHVIIMWFAILTSQKGQMLDVWLLVTMTMDFLPLIFALLDTWRKGLFEFKE